MNTDEAVRNLQNVLSAISPDIPAQVRATRERVLGEATKRGREIDHSAIALLVSAFQQLIQDTAQQGLA